MKSKVLVIDDSEEMREIVEVSLSGDRIEVRGAADGEVGLKSARAWRPDLILLDVDMPDADGFEVYRELREDRVLMEVPVIFLTAARSTGNKVEGLRLGAADYVIKPFHGSELQARVDNVIERRQQIQALRAAAHCDLLTGLWNRAYFEDRVRAQVALAESGMRALSCILVEVDGFQRIDVSFGHGVSDGILRSVGRVVSAEAMPHHIVCRYGGERFAILCPETELREAGEIAESIRARVASCAHGADGLHLDMTCSVGVTQYGAEVLSLVQQAERALDLAVKNGRNHVGIVR